MEVSIEKRDTTVNIGDLLLLDGKWFMLVKDQYDEYVKLFDLKNSKVLYSETNNVESMLEKVNPKDIIKNEDLIITNMKNKY
jgi:hypothetical protein